MESDYSIHVVSASIGMVIGALIMYYHSSAKEATARWNGFSEAWRIAESRRTEEIRTLDKYAERETRVWQDRVHDLKNALHPEKLDKSSEAREARKREGKRGSNKT